MRIGRVGGVGLAVAGILRQVRRQLAARGVDGGLHVARGGIDVAIEIELESDRGRAERAGRGHLVDAGDASELALERRGNGGGHGSGLAPGRPAPTPITGKSTSGSDATGSSE